MRLLKAFHGKAYIDYSAIKRGTGESPGKKSEEDKIKKKQGKARIIWNSLKDKKSVGIIDYNEKTQTGTGFVFEKYESSELLNAIKRAYKLYENKPCTDDSAEDCKNCLEMRVSLANAEIIYNEWGDSKHYNDRRNKITRLPSDQEIQIKI